MAPFRRPRFLEPSAGPIASTSAAPTRPGTPRSVSPSSQSHRGIFGISIDKDAAVTHMKETARLALEVIQTGSRLAGDATSDVAVPGLSIGLKALAEILRKVQTMNTTITGVQELYEHIKDLNDAIYRLRLQCDGQPLPPQMAERIKNQETKWQQIGERAKKIKNHGKLKRFLTSDTDAKELQGLVDEMIMSIQVDVLEGIHNIEIGIGRIQHEVGVVSVNVEAVRDDVETLSENVEAVREGVGGLLIGVGAVHEGLEGIGEGVDGVLGEIAVAQDGIAGVCENVDAVRQVVEDGVEALQDTVAGNTEALWEKVEAVDANVRELKLQVAKAIATKLDKSFLDRYAKMAPYYANEVRRSCLEGTRVEFLQEIYTWITAAYEGGKAIPEDGIVLWINGMGGTGKTTVARSVAEWSDHRKVLGGSFFCSRSDSECSDPNLVFPTLCRQLCEHHQPFKDKVQEVLDRDPNTASYGLYRQFEELIVLPLEALDSPFPRFVFVFDALDELKDKGPASAKSTILLVIAKYVSRIAKFLLLVMTSRPEADITALFEAKREDSLKDTTTPLFLRDIPLYIALKDIRLYIDYEFKANIGFLAVEPDWPSAEEKNTLADQSQGLFIYVATAIKFIMDKTHRDPKGRMDLLAAPRAKLLAPHEFLSSLYTTILVASYEKVSTEHAARLRDVLSAVVLAQEALSPLSVARLVGLDVTRVRSTLTGLHSVLHVPPEDHEPIRIIHPTFPEFLLSPEAAPLKFHDAAPVPSHLHLQPAERHWYLFSRCVKVMSGALKRDMIEIRCPAVFQSEVADLKERITAAVKPHIGYACRFWGYHLRDGIRGAATIDVSQLFHDSVHEWLLCWIETCSWLDAIDKVIFALDVVREVCQMPGGQFTDLSQFLADCRRFIVTYSPCIHAAPLQLYHSALGISPTASHVRTQYAHEREHALVVEHGASADWTPCLDTIAGHAGTVFAVAFSPDGSCFVTGGWDTKATIRKTATRTPVLSFDGHTGWVWCAAFSPDGLHVASGGDDKKVCMWQALSGEPVHTLQGHTGEIHSVAYSGDGRRIVSVTCWGEVKLWDTTDGRCLLTLDKTGNRTYQVGFSSDGGIIARGSRASVSLYNVSSTASEALEFPETVEACTFSPDGRYIAARSTHVIRVWAWPEKTVVRSINVPDDLSGRLAFSRDGMLIGCGSENGSVRLWPVASEDPPFILQGHTGNVNDLACSLDGSQVISVAWEDMIRVWDRTLSTSPTAEHAAVDSPPPPAPGPPRFALLRSGDEAIALLHLPTLGVGSEHRTIGAQSSDGAPTAVLFSDAVSAYAAALQTVHDWNGHASVRAWASLTGQQHTRLSKCPFAVSLDGSLMAYRSPADDKVVDVCNLRTGTVVATLTGHTRCVCSIAFSPDNARIATGSRDVSVKVWDTLTGALLCGHTEHADSTCAVAFSPDGRLVASGSFDGTVRVFDVSMKRVVHKLEPHRDWAMHVMFAADNAHLVALDLASWVYVWDITTGARIREFSLQDHTHLRSPIFLPDGAGILVRGDNSITRTVSLWKPGTRTWPAYHITEDGWVYAMSPGKTQRLCWLPPELRALWWSDGSRLYVSETRVGRNARRKLTVLNVSPIEEYIDGLEALL